MGRNVILEGVRPTLHGRVKFYAIAAVLAALIFCPLIPALGLGMLGIPVLVCGAAFYLICYLPLVDWPWLVGRRTGSIAAASVSMLFAALLPFAAPLGYNAKLTAPAAEPDLEAPKTLIVAYNILVGGEGRWEHRNACGRYCQALLWDGIVDHVLAYRQIGRNQHIESATLYALTRAADCSALDDNEQPPTPREGWCIEGRTVADPAFDIVIAVDTMYGGNKRLPFGVGEHLVSETSKVKIFQCQKQCTPLLATLGETGERLAVPLTLHFEGGLDSGGPFGFFLARRPFELNSAQDVIGRLFRPTVVSRHAFSGDVPHGGPAKPLGYPTARPNVLPGPSSTEIILAKYRKLDEAREAYVAKLYAIYAQHPECPMESVIIPPGNDPKYGGCEPHAGAQVPQTAADLRRALER